MPPRERIDFTHRELEALSNLLSMTADHDEWLEELPGLDRVERGALKRASEKVARAHRKVTTGAPADPQVYCASCENRGATYSSNGGLTVTGCTRCGHLKGQHPNGLEARSG